MKLWFIFQIFLICQHFSILLFFNAFLFILQVSNFDTLSWKQDQRYFNPKSAANYKDFMETHSITITTRPIWSARSSQSTYQINLSIQGCMKVWKLAGASIIWWENLLPLVEIGLTDLPKSGPWDDRPYIYIYIYIQESLAPQRGSGLKCTCRE